MNSDKNYLDKTKIKSMLAEVLKKTKTYTEEECEDIIFHMTDWLENLTELFEVYSNPKNSNYKKVKKVLIDFLVHVPNHISAASKIMLDQPTEDIFNVGAVRKDNFLVRFYSRVMHFKR